MCVATVTTTLMFLFSLGEPSCLAVPCRGNVYPSTEKSAEKVKELMLEKDCCGLDGNVARPQEGTDDEDVKFIV